MRNKRILYFGELPFNPHISNPKNYDTIFVHLKWRSNGRKLYDKELCRKNTFGATKKSENVFFTS